MTMPRHHNKSLHKLSNWNLLDEVFAQGQSLSQLLSCQSCARAMPCATRMRARARSYSPSLFVSEQNSEGVSPACPSSLLDALARRSRAPLQDAAPSPAARVSHTVMGPTPSLPPSLSLSLPLSLHPAMHARSTLERAHGARARTLRPARRAGKVRSTPSLPAHTRRARRLSRLTPGPAEGRSGCVAGPAPPRRPARSAAPRGHTHCIRTCACTLPPSN